MNKSDAIKEIKNIQTGGFDRNKIEVPKGLQAIRYWDDSMFSYGMEYGAIHALMVSFDISMDEL